MLIKEKESDKRDRILETALSLFAHYGFSKTTVNDIADHISLSSTLIYHYYPDKNALFEAVLNKLTLNYKHEVEEAFAKSASAEEALNNQQTIRNKILQQYHKLFFGELMHSSKDVFMQLKKTVDLNEERLVVAAINMGVQSGEFELKMSVKEHATLILTVLSSVFSSSCQNVSVVMKEADLEELTVLQQQVLTQFILALKYKSKVD
jgi:TetR/AcrR family transcriptional regulator